MRRRRGDEEEEEEGEEDWCSESRILNNNRPPPVQLLHNAKFIFVCLTFRGSLKRYPSTFWKGPPSIIVAVANF